MEPEIIQLIDEHGHEVDFELVASFDLDDTRYAVVVPVDGDGEDAYILRVEQDENGNDIFVGIEDEDEFNDAVEAYNELMEEYEEYYDDDFDEEE
ncbi:hypothetical protein JCM16816_11980 [Thermoanaerobacter brockii subsp. lactiethylicus]|jgi:uncharacterized protein YrzB (UPF0473 family)|uniref:DUF1292 domain-containing protein n=1 Tax=unclassified Thermoanaerobacter TaxID=2636821 RepID=UPI0001642398|nr:DUF1292 domain-containing protein [Thermoanaerobacter sp. X514]ABY92779.1 protein of unknown function DUF1292 [Thermoanaerobacter sp. X514]MDI3500501.1 hypothetical protein [Thermoanaerobacter sp.]HCD10213.1 DUF1292 domain-containing protein [Thermoanaerobacter sp.]